MQLKNDPTITRIRETRHKISEEFGHDPRKVIAHYIQLQKIEEKLRLQQKHAEEVRLVEPVKA